MKTTAIPPGADVSHLSAADAAKIMEAFTALSKSTTQVKGLLRLLADKVSAPIYEEGGKQSPDQACGIEFLAATVSEQLEAAFGGLIDLIEPMANSEQSPPSLRAA